MTDQYDITLARPQDLRLLGAIELAAAQLLRGHAPETVLNEVTSHRDLSAAQREGRLWVVLTGDTPVGFAHVELFEPNAVHLDELDVHPDHGRRGLGTRLVKAVCAWAQARGDLPVTLATFREVPWNMPFYSRLGFEEIPQAELSPALRSVVAEEIRRGLDPARRVVMRRLPSESVEVISKRDEAECEELAAFLVDRIYEFNANATGYVDGMLLAGCVRSETGEIIAGFNGHTWGGCCELANVWVHAAHRGRGLGARLLRSAEAEAVARGCVQVVLATHSFQAPGFYERMGYERKYAIEGLPSGHADIIYVKVLQEQTAPTRWRIDA